MKVTFEEKGHKYTDEVGDSYTSVTTLIDKYHKPFDIKYWSRYKAIQKWMTDYKGGESEWLKIKRMVGYKSINRWFEGYAKPAEKIKVSEIQTQIIKDWLYIGDTARDEGHDLHAKKEMGWKKEMYHKVDGVIHVMKPQDMVDYDFAQIPDGIYSELLIYVNEWKLAGQADLVVVDKPYIDIDGAPVRFIVPTPLPTEAMLEQHLLVDFSLLRI